jgi:hypothetical protein
VKRNKKAEFNALPSDPNLVNLSDPAGRRPCRAWRILSIEGEVVEQITIDEKNRRLAAGEFETGTMLHHPRAGTLIVAGEKGSVQEALPEDGE